MGAVSEIEQEIKQLAEATAHAQSECFALIAPLTNDFQNVKLHWQNIRLDVPTKRGIYATEYVPTNKPQPTPEQWAEYFTYWRSLDLLPKDVREEMLTRHNQELLKAYYSQLLKSRDANKDGSLSLSEMLSPFEISHLDNYRAQRNERRFDDYEALLTPTEAIGALETIYSEYLQLK